MSQSVPSTHLIGAPPAHSNGSRWRSIMMSFLTHCVLVVILFLFCFNSPKGPDTEIRRAGIVLTTNTDENKTEYLDEKDVSEESDIESSEPTETNIAADPAQTPPPSLSVELETPDRPELPGFETFEANNLDASNMVTVDSKEALNLQHELNAEELKLIEADRKLLAARAPQGDPTTVSVFGTGGLSGRSFVFVLDRSKSMGAQGLGVISAARKEITAAVGQLQPHHTFQIVGYHERTVTMNRRQLLPATEQNKRDVPNFIGKLAAFGATNHESGLVAAAAFKPDIVVLLTDGGYPDLHDGKLKMLKRFFQGTEVHCIQFGIGSNQQTINFMSKLADQNGGTFRYIDVTQWKRGEAQQ